MISIQIFAHSVRCGELHARVLGRAARKSNSQRSCAMSGTRKQHRQFCKRDCASSGGGRHASRQFPYNCFDLEQPLHQHRAHKRRDHGRRAFPHRGPLTSCHQLTPSRNRRVCWAVFPQCRMWSQRSLKSSISRRQEPAPASCYWHGYRYENGEFER